MNAFNVLQLAFWMAFAAVAYTYVGYPVLLEMLARLRHRKPVAGSIPRSVSVIIAAKNEQATIGRRVGEFLSMLEGGGIDGELIIVSDGSTDHTAEQVRKAAAESVSKVPCRIIDLPSSGGKAAALTCGCEIACKEIIVFADARQTWAADALSCMLSTFADPSIGAVSGDLLLESSPGVMAGIGAYWRYEKWLRRREGEVYSMVGATGAISAVRRELFRPIPAGTLLDDVYWPLRVAMQGRRVVHVRGAVAFDRLPEKARDEFRRKVRTLSGNFQLAVRLPGALLPWKNPIWLQFLSHKLMRLVVPWLLLVMLAISGFLAITAPLYQILVGGEILFYLVGVAGMTASVGGRSKLASAAASFLVLNAAAWMAFWVWASGRATRSWTKLSYTGPKQSADPLLTTVTLEPAERTS